MNTQHAVYPDLEGKTVLISGGASGIGEFMVRAFAAQGSKVGFVDRAQSQGERLAALLSSRGHTVEFVNCDITDEIAYKAAIGRFEHSLGPISVLVNNAANDARHTLEEVDIGDVRPAHRRQPQARFLRRQGRGANDEKRGRRGDHQPRLRRLDDGLRWLPGVRRQQSRRPRHDPCAGS